MLFYNILTMEQLLEVADRYLGLTSAIAMVSILFVFTASIVKELHSAVDGKLPDYRRVIWTTVLVIFSFLMYRVIFRGVVDIAQKISAMMLNYDKWAEFINLLNNTLSQIGNYEIISLNITVFLLSLSLLLATTADGIFMLIRNFFLAALYILGPIILVVSIYKPARKIFNRWILLTTQVLVWEILLRILQGLILEVDLEQYILSGDLVVTFIVAIVLIISYVSIPLISVKLVSTENISLFYEILLNSKHIFNTKLNIQQNKILQRTFSLAKNITVASKTFLDKINKQKDKKETSPKEEERTR